MDYRIKFLMKCRNLEELKKWVLSYLKDNEILYFKIKDIQENGYIRIFKCNKLYPNIHIIMEIEDEEKGEYETIPITINIISIFDIITLNFGGELKDYEINNIKLENKEI